ncbi:MAG: glutaminase A [Bacteroidales bacterium]
MNKQKTFIDNTLIEQEVKLLFDALCTGDNSFISKECILEAINKSGIDKNDGRLKEILHNINGNLNQESFYDLSSQSALLRKCLSGNLVIPDFESFSKNILNIFKKTAKIKEGKVADYIPQLARVNPDYFAVSICTIDGQEYSIGDYDQKFCFQSTCKPIIYCLAQEEVGAKKVHEHVGFEPSGLGFNELSLDRNKKPHNPMINAGAIMCSSLIKRKENIADKFDFVMQKMKELCNPTDISFNNSVYLSERQTADRNFALAYYMRENNAFPASTDILETLDFYFQCCSIETNAKGMAQIGAALANSGISPFTEKRIFNNQTVQNCLSLMHTCGMYDYSGEFAFKIGVPAKSGVSGALLMVIPDLMGICIWSPLLDRIGNSVKGIEFCKDLAKQYNIHNFNSITGEKPKKDPKSQRFDDTSKGVLALIEAAGKGDINEVQKINASGVPLDAVDYDGRTALHLAVAERQVEMVQFLFDNHVNPKTKDRWGHTPISEAKDNSYKEIVEIFSSTTNDA